MSDIQVAANPFGMMINPEAIIDAMNRSDLLERLQRRVYRPLDKPMIPKVDGSADVECADEADDDFGVVDANEPASNDLSDVIAVSSRYLVD